MRANRICMLILSSVFVVMTGCAWVQEVDPVIDDNDVIINVDNCTKDIVTLDDSEIEVVFDDREITVDDFKLFTDRVEKTLRGIQKELRLLRYKE
jgi:hypothetical protein